MEQLNLLSSEEARAWYAVYTVVRHEKKVNKALIERDTETYLPLAKTLRRWKDRKKVVEFPLFPGYLFAKIDLRERWAVLNTRGVVSIVGAGGMPIPVPEEQIEGIRKLLSSNYRYDPYPYLTQGKEVVVVNGPLQGVRGRILERRGDVRLILSVDLLQRSLSVEVDIRDVEPA